MSSYGTLEGESRHYSITNLEHQLDVLDAKVGAATNILQRVWFYAQRIWIRHLLRNTLTYNARDTLN